MNHFKSFWDTVVSEWMSEKWKNKWGFPSYIIDFTIFLSLFTIWQTVLQWTFLLILHFSGFFFKKILFILIGDSNLQYCQGFCHTFIWISHGCTCIPHREPPYHLPPHPISQGCPSAPALSTLSYASNLDWWSVSHMIIYMFQCYSLKSSHPRLLPQSPKVCPLHLCLFCCLAYIVIVTIFLNSIYMC